MGFLSDLFDPGKDERQAASAATRAAQLTNFGATSPFGGGTFNARTGAVNFNLSPELQSFQQQLLGQASSGATGLQNLFGGLQGDLSGIAGQLGGMSISANPFDQSRGLQRGFREAAFAQIPALTQNLDQLATERLSLLREQARPFESAAMGQLNQRLFGTGQGAVRGTAAQELGGGRLAESFGRGLGQADLQRQIAAEQFALGRQNQALGVAQGATGLGLGINNQAFQQQLGAGGFNAGLLGQQANLAQQLFGSGLQAQQGGLQSLLSGLGGLGGLQQLSINPFAAALQANVARSNAQLGVGGQLSNIAGQTPNVLGDLLAGGLSAAGAAGGFGKLFSDRRLKDSLTLIGQEPITGLDIYVWEWNEDARKAGVHREPPIGLIAQEVQEHYPDAIVEDEKTGYLKIDYEALHDLAGV